MRRRRGFTARARARGFTSSLVRELQLLGLLVPFPFEAHARLALPLVRPFADLSRVPDRGCLAPAGAVSATTASADFSLRATLVGASPFQAQGEISPGKARRLHRTTAGYTSPPFGRESFADFSPLALVGAASDPVSVRRLAVSLPASFSAPSRALALRFASVVATNSREDFHLLTTCRAGHTERSRCAAVLALTSRA